MLTTSKILLIIGGLLLILDAVMMAARIPNPLFRISLTLISKSAVASILIL